MGTYILGAILIIVGVVLVVKAFKEEKGTFEKYGSYFVALIFLIPGGIIINEEYNKQKRLEWIEFENKHSTSNPSFTGRGSYRKYKCSVGGCLCTKYEKKSTYNTDCKNCGHHKGEHY
jgi:hypothetical protein